MDLYLDKVPLYLIDFDKGQILNIKAKDIMFNGCKNDNKNIKKITYIIRTSTFVLNILGDEDYWFCSDSCDKIVTDRLIRSGCHIKK